MASRIPWLLSKSMNQLRHTIPILYRPRHEWNVIAAEAASIKNLYLGYIIPLALLTPIALKIRLMRDFENSSGIEAIFFEFTWTGMVANYAWGLGEIYVLAWVLNASSFLPWGKSVHARSLAVLAFSATPVWIAYALLGLPMLSLGVNEVVRIFSYLYSGCLHYLGFRAVMHIEARIACVYVGVVAVAYWGSNKARDTIIPAVMDFYRQWPILNQGTRELVGIACVVFLVSVVLCWAYWRRLSVVHHASDEMPPNEDSKG